MLIVTPFESAPDVALFFVRGIVGAFFLLARFRWVYDPSRPQEPWFNHCRHDHLAWKLCTCGYSRNVYLAGAAAVVELLGGLALVFGLLTQLAAFGILVVLIGATYCTAREKTMKQNPVDAIDVVSCYTWTVEPHLIIGCIAVILAGPGRYSLDAVIPYLLF